jgi:RHS repeat-associated protein
LGSNRTSEESGTKAINFTYNKVNELTSPGPATYDADGQPLKLGSQTFQWDAAGRLISVTDGANTTRFAYDGSSRRERITQLLAGKVLSDKRYFWCDDGLCLETDAANNNAVSKRYYAEGFTTPGQRYYYAMDDLQSVRQLVDQAGAIQASYDYDPYGVRTKLAGGKDSDFSFAGLFHESQSGLDLAIYRAYNASLGRWLNRDPEGMDGGMNRYAYAYNAPVSLIDPEGAKGQRPSPSGWVPHVSTPPPGFSLGPLPPPPIPASLVPPYGQWNTGNAHITNVLGTVPGGRGMYFRVIKDVANSAVYVYYPNGAPYGGATGSDKIWIPGSEFFNNGQRIQYSPLEEGTPQQTSNQAYGKIQQGPQEQRYAPPAVRNGAAAYGDPSNPYGPPGGETNPQTQLEQKDCHGTVKKR